MSWILIVKGDDSTLPPKPDFVWVAFTSGKHARFILQAKYWNGGWWCKNMLPFANIYAWQAIEGPKEVPPAPKGEL